MEPEEWAASASQSWRGWVAYARGLASQKGEEAGSPLKSVASKQVQSALESFRGLPQDAKPGAILSLWSSTLAR